MTVLPDPPLLAAAAGAVAVGARGRWRRLAADPGARGMATAAAVRGGMGVLVVLGALAPPLDALAHASFAWHMVQHQLLTLVAAPLLASAAPLTTVRYAVGRPARAAAGPIDTFGVRVLVAGVVAVATLLLWHLPPLYDAALTNPLVHQIEHVTLLVTATVMWGAVITAARDDRAFASIVVLALTAISGAALGVVLLTSGAPLYAYGAVDPVAALDHQRLGGALMKVGALVVHAGAAVWLFVRWMERLEDRSGP